MAKVRLIATREFKIQVKRISFWLVTLGLPLLMFLLSLFTVFMGIYVGSQSQKGDEEDSLPNIMAIVDGANLQDWELLNVEEPKSSGTGFEEIMGELQLSPEIRDKLSGIFAKVVAGDLQYQTFDTVESATESLKAGKLRAVLAIDPDFLTNQEVSLLLNSEESKDRISTSEMRRRLRHHLLAQYYAPDKLDQILDPLEGKTIYLQPPEEKEEEEEEKKKPFEKLSAIGMPMIFGMAMFLVLITSTDRLVRGLMEEKSNRVIELLLSSVTAEELMAGKVVGLGMLGLLQLTIWGSLILLPLSWLFLFVKFSILHMLTYLVFFVFGYFLLAILVLGLGSLGSNLQEANQWMILVVMMAVMPLTVMPLLAENPTGTLAVVFTYIPFSAPFMVVTRMSMEAISMGEIFLSLAVLVASNLLLLKICAKIFRIGILMTGKSPTPAAVWRALRSM